MKKKQEIFFVYKDIKVKVRPSLSETTYSFKLDKRDIFNIILPINDSESARKVVQKEIDKLSLN